MEAIGAPLGGWHWDGVSRGLTCWASSVFHRRWVSGGYQGVVFAELGRTRGLSSAGAEAG